jgi:hypothetical protein
MYQAMCLPPEADALDVILPAADIICTIHITAQGMERDSLVTAAGHWLRRRIRSKRMMLWAAFWEFGQKRPQLA